MSHIKELKALKPYDFHNLAPSTYDVRNNEDSGGADKGPKGPKAAKGGKGGKGADTKKVDKSKPKKMKNQTAEEDDAELFK